jgi:hypothetical protein
LDYFQVSLGSVDAEQAGLALDEASQLLDRAAALFQQVLNFLPLKYQNEYVACKNADLS